MTFDLNNFLKNVDYNPQREMASTPIKYTPKVIAFYVATGLLIGGGFIAAITQCSRSQAQASNIEMRLQR